MHFFPRSLQLTQGLILNALNSSVHGSPSTHSGHRYEFSFVTLLPRQWAAAAILWLVWSRPGEICAAQSLSSVSSTTNASKYPQDPPGLRFDTPKIGGIHSVLHHETDLPGTGASFSIETALVVKITAESRHLCIVLSASRFPEFHTAASARRSKLVLEPDSFALDGLQELLWEWNSPGGCASGSQLRIELPTLWKFVG